MLLIEMLLYMLLVLGPSGLLYWMSMKGKR